MPNEGTNRLTDAVTAPVTVCQDCCLSITSDGIDVPVSWKAGAKLVGLDHSRVRFRFSLKNAKLFSFWVD